jgi:uncharacterized protein
LKENSIRAIALFMFCMALTSSLSAQDSSCHPRLISVTGTAEIKVVPDEVAITLGVDSRDKDLTVAKADNDQRMKKLLNVAHAAGVESKNIQTSALTMGPEYSDERIPKFLDYQVSQVVTITLTDLSKYEDLMTNSVKAGVNRVDGINFFVADPTKYREQARLQALRAARDKAKVMAAELGQAIGKPLEISEEPEVEALDATANVNMRYKLPMLQDQSTVAGGQVTIRMLVRVSFQLE